MCHVKPRSYATNPCLIFPPCINIGSQIKDQSAMKMTLNQLLVEMDGFAQNHGIIVIAATNFPDSLDSALIRPGRFDKVVDVSIPDIAGRKAILELYAKKVRPRDNQTAHADIYDRSQKRVSIYL
jgi:ATP-dependent metalloprotease